MPEKKNMSKQNNFLTIYRSILEECIRRAYQSDKISAKKMYNECVSIISKNKILRLERALFVAIQKSDKTKAEECLKQLNEFNVNDISNINTLFRDSFPTIKMNKSSEIERKVFRVILEGKTQVSEILEAKKTGVHKEKDRLQFISNENVVKLAVQKYNSRYSTILTNEEKKLLKILLSKDMKKIQEQQLRITKAIKNYARVIENRGNSDPLILKNIDKLMESTKTPSVENLLKLLDFVNVMEESIR